MTKQQSKWNADAEAALMGFVVPVESVEHLKHMIGYVLFTLKNVMDTETSAEEIYKSSMKYNSNGDSVTHFTMSNSAFGVLMTFVRDGKMTEKKLLSPNGVLAYVYNMDYPDCSELGYTFFQKVSGKIKRVG